MTRITMLIFSENVASTKLNNSVQESHKYIYEDGYPRILPMGSRTKDVSGFQDDTCVISINNYIVFTQY